MTLTGKSGFVSCGVTAPFSWVLVCTRFGCALQESVLPVLRKLCNKIPLAFKVRFSGCPQSLCQFPRLESLLSALELLQQCKNSFGMIVFQYVGHLLGISAVGPMVTSSSWTYTTCCASLVCCSQSPHPCGKPLVILPLQETLKHSKAILAHYLVQLTAPFPGS